MKGKAGGKKSPVKRTYGGKGKPGKPVGKGDCK